MHKSDRAVQYVINEIQKLEQSKLALLDFPQDVSSFYEAARDQLNLAKLSVTGDITEGGVDVVAYSISPAFGQAYGYAKGLAQVSTGAMTDDTGLLTEGFSNLTSGISDVAISISKGDSKYIDPTLVTKNMDTAKHIHALENVTDIEHLGALGGVLTGSYNFYQGFEGLSEIQKLEKLMQVKEALAKNSVDIEGKLDALKEREQLLRSLLDTQNLQSVDRQRFLEYLRQVAPDEFERFETYDNEIRPDDRSYSERYRLEQDLRRPSNENEKAYNTVTEAQGVDQTTSSWKKTDEKNEVSTFNIADINREYTYSSEHLNTGLPGIETYDLNVSERSSTESHINLQFFSEDLSNYYASYDDANEKKLDYSDPNMSHEDSRYGADNSQSDKGPDYAHHLRSNAEQPNDALENTTFNVSANERASLYSGSEETFDLSRVGYTETEFEFRYGSTDYQTSDFLNTNFSNFDQSNLTNNDSSSSWNNSDQDWPGYYSNYYDTSYQNINYSDLNMSPSSLELDTEGDVFDVLNNQYTTGSAAQ